MRTNGFVQGVLADLFRIHANSMVLKKSVELDLAYYETPSFYNNLQRARQDAGNRPISVLQATFRLIQNLISLDAKTECEIFKQFQELTEGKITILISHRFSTVRMADRIFVIEKGKIIEQGSHNKLMELDGKYAQMFLMQAESYR